MNKQEQMSTHALAYNADLFLLTKAQQIEKASN